MSLEYKDCNFQSRLAFVLKGRDEYPWAESVGIPSGSVDRMLKGKIPGPDILRLVMLAENVSLSWLVEGVGPPYIVRGFATDEACRAHFEEQLTEPGWHVHLLTDGGRVRVLVLHGSALVRYRGKKDVPYTELDVIAGAGRATLARVAAMPHRETRADTDTVAAVAAGHLAGTWDLLGDDGLLNHYQEIEPAGLRVAELSDAGYAQEETDAYSEEERRWVELFRRLDPHHRVRVKEVGDAFAAALERGRGAGHDGDD